MWRCWIHAWHDPLLQNNPSGLVGSASCGTMSTTMSQHGCTLGLAATKKFVSLVDHKRSFTHNLLLQSGEDGSHVFVRIRNEWSSESKQLRRAITITQCILLPCLLSCLISQLGAFPGKAHVEFFPPSLLQLPPLTSLPASLTPLPATLEPQHRMSYQIKKKKSL